MKLTPHRVVYNAFEKAGLILEWPNFMIEMDQCTSNIYGLKAMINYMEAGESPELIMCVAFEKDNDYWQGMFRAIEFSEAKS